MQCEWSQMKDSFIPQVSLVLNYVGQSVRKQVPPDLYQVNPIVNQVNLILNHVNLVLQQVSPVLYHISPV